MEERMIRYYSKEEEFLDEFDDTVSAAVGVLNGEWKPSYYTNDQSRTSNRYFLSTGQLNCLVFDSAAVYHDNNGFSSVQIVLKSSTRLVNVQVRRVGDKFVAEIIIDKPNS